MRLTSIFHGNESLDRTRMKKALHVAAPSTVYFGSVV